MSEPIDLPCPICDHGPGYHDHECPVPILGPEDTP